MLTLWFETAVIYSCGLPGKPLKNHRLFKDFFIVQIVKENLGHRSCPHGLQEKLLTKTNTKMKIVEAATLHKLMYIIKMTIFSRGKIFSAIRFLVQVVQSWAKLDSTFYRINHSVDNGLRNEKAICSGGSRGGAPGAPPSYFLPNWGPKGPKKVFGDLPLPLLPVSKGLDDRAPPLISRSVSGTDLLTPSRPCFLFCYWICLVLLNWNRKWKNEMKCGSWSQNDEGMRMVYQGPIL